MKELENITGIAELDDAELELVSGRGGEEGGFGGSGGKGGYGKVQGYRNDNEIINNFSFRHDTAINGLIKIGGDSENGALNNFTCNSFNNTAIGH
ncbi:hypothetical protein [Ktedonospora formicarum]|uniref:Uncharacterized protein n=1 Tax=Ktedonospora formicarum TaxID=2778364 RepID=A0A8J3IC94_9CHLR|nr:hypothetical protein [Ktedonospora formicarum]GHO49459.1 hypothetical protein KSX_76220 [Ktedonospora formicarum]